MIGHTYFDRPPARPVLRLLLLVAALVVLAACGQAGAAGDGVATLKSAAPGASPSPSVDPQQAFVDYARCMREHGVDMPDPQVDAGGGKFSVSIGASGAVDQDKMSKADAACNHFIQSVTLGGGGPGLDPAAQDAMLAFARCMRDHGVDMPDPQFENGGGMVMIGGPGTAIDPSSRTFQDAQQACQSLLPGAGESGADGPSVQVGPGGDGPSVQVGPGGAGPGTQAVPAVPGAGGN